MSDQIPPLVDLHSFSEAQRIDAIGHQVTVHLLTVGVLVDTGPGYEGKGDRYIAAMSKKFPTVEVIYRGPGPVANVELIKFAPRQS